MSDSRDDWSAFLSAYHAEHPGITEDLLDPMRDAAGRDPYAWLVEGLPPGGGVWDVCCGSAPVADRVGSGRYRGIDISTAELAVARARRPEVSVAEADVLVASPPADTAAVTVAMALMLLDLDAFLRHLSRFLAPGTPLHAIVPTRAGVAGSDYGHLLELLGQAGTDYRQPLEPAALPARFAAAGFDLYDDEEALFRRPVTSPADVDLVVASFYARGSEPSRIDDARRWLRDHGQAPGYALPYPLRRLRARRAGE